MGFRVAPSELKRWQAMGLVAAPPSRPGARTRARSPARPRSPRGSTPTTPVPPSWKVTLHLPGLKLVSRSNAREHWRVRHNRDKSEASAVLLAWSGAGLTHWTPPLPVTVVMTRCGGRPMDSDNLAGAFKAVRDALAALLGVDDGNPGVAWKCLQTARDEPGVRVTIRPTIRSAPA